MKKLIKFKYLHLTLSLTLLLAGCASQPPKPAEGQNKGVPSMDAKAVAKAERRASSNKQAAGATSNAAGKKPSQPSQGEVVSEEQLPEVWEKLRQDMETPDPDYVPLPIHQGSDEIPEDSEEEAMDGLNGVPLAQAASSTGLEISADLWDRVRSGYQFPDYDNARVRAEIAWYVRHQAYLDRVVDRASYYLHYIVEEIERRQLPTELALLPVVESAFQPMAYSRDRAAGIWQFIPSTAKVYGLKINWWYDGRRDISASTKAALDYLEKLNKDFEGDWLLALASYNAGEGRVSRAVKKNKGKGKPTDFWSLDLPRETDGYVPRLIAIAMIVAEPEKYGIRLNPIQNEPYATIVHTGGQLDLAMVAELSDSSLEEIFRLNPGFNRWATDPNGPHNILLPKEKVDHFKAKLSELPPEKRVRWERHVVKKGETLSVIARKYDTTVSVLQQVNKINGNRIHVGKDLIIPVSRQMLASHAIPSIKQTEAEKRSKKKGKIIHTVRNGETLWLIAKRYGVSIKQLSTWNDLDNASQIRRGQRLTVWAGT